MAHTHEKLVVLLLGWRHGENGNHRWQYSSLFYCGKHKSNVTQYYYLLLHNEVSTNNAQDMAEDLQTVPHTTCIKLLRDNQKKGKWDWGWTQTNGEAKINMHDQVDSCHRQIEKPQRQLLNRDVHCGCNTVSRGIRSRNQGDIDGTSRVVLPCPSS